MCLPCCWPFADIWLEEPPKKQEQQEKPKPEMQPTGYVYMQTSLGINMSYYTYKPAAAAKATALTQPKPQNGNDQNYYTYRPASAPAALPAPSAAQHCAGHCCQHQHLMPIAYFYQQPQYVAMPQGWYHPAQSVQPQALAPASAPDGSANNPYIWNGNTKAEIDRQNLVIAQNTGVMQPKALVPDKASDDQQWWVRELDGGYTLRSTQAIQDSLQPGYWTYAQNGGYPYFIRQKAG
ncbi:MAG: hypothetical protein M1817_000753 [Caeruleum heppii]|nr:MAG: hypothetical protein M1817_000753 [Caeruleum heppii]